MHDLGENKNVYVATFYGTIREPNINVFLAYLNDNNVKIEKESYQKINRKNGSLAQLGISRYRRQEYFGQSVDKLKKDRDLSHFMTRLANYVPTMKSVVWSVICNDQLIAYLISDESVQYRLELAILDIRVSKLKPKKIFCGYHYDDELWGKWFRC